MVKDIFFKESVTSGQKVKYHKLSKIFYRKGATSGQTCILKGKCHKQSNIYLIGKVPQSAKYVFKRKSVTSPYRYIVKGGTNLVTLSLLPVFHLAILFYWLTIFLQCNLVTLEEQIVVYATNTTNLFHFCRLLQPKCSINHFLLGVFLFFSFF